LDNYDSALAHGVSLSTTVDKTRIDGVLKESIIELFWFVLGRDNCHVQSCKLLGKAFSAVNDQNFPEDDYEPAQVAFPPNVIAEINECGEVPHALDIAAVTDDTVIGNRVIRFKLKNTNTWKQIPVTHPDIEPLSYPLLFLEGEKGWGDNVAKVVPFCSYIVSRMLMPEKRIVLFETLLIQNGYLQIDFNYLQDYRNIGYAIVFQDLSIEGDIPSLRIIINIIS